MDIQSLAGSQPTGALAPQTKPDGGFRFVSVVQLMMVFWAHRAGIIRWRDVRVWFACLEASARRQAARTRKRPRYTIAELTRLLGGRGEREIRASGRRLKAAGLIRFEKGELLFAKSPDDLTITDVSGLWATIRGVGQKDRLIPMPRRTIRFMANDVRRVLAATMMGHAIRCLYYRKGECRSDGSCKASWIGKVFDVDVRGVKRARKHLQSIGWLSRENSAHWHRQRWGGRARVNLSWSRAGQEERKKPPPRESISVTKPPPPESERKLLTDHKNQKPALAADRPAGFFRSTQSASSVPTLRNVVVDDLRDTSRTMVLFEQAVERGFVKRTESDRLRILGAAERAVRLGTKNPCGFFFEMIRSKLWKNINHAEEERARQRLRRHSFGNENCERAFIPKSRPFRNELPLDAQIVAAVKKTLERHCADVDPFEALRREKPEWTKDRWVRAETEIANWALTSCRNSIAGDEVESVICPHAGPPFLTSLSASGSMAG